jgi:hypothetical protein
MKKEVILKLDKTKFALAAAILMATLVLITTLIAIITPAQSFATTIINIYGPLGYSVSLLGAIIGTVYSFIDTFILAWIFAWLYNKLL